jgi:hypothetical protein
MSHTPLCLLSINYWKLAEEVEIQVLVRSEFPLYVSFKPPLGPAQPPIQCVQGALFQRLKRPGPEADRSHTVSAEVKETRIYT